MKPLISITLVTMRLPRSRKKEKAAAKTLYKMLDIFSNQEKVKHYEEFRDLNSVVPLLPWLIFGGLILLGIVIGYVIGYRKGVEKERQRRAREREAM